MFDLTNLSGFGAAPLPATLAYIGSAAGAVNGSTGTTKTYASAPLGTAADNKQVIIACATGDGSAGLNIASTGCTIDGVTAKLLGEIVTTTGTRHGVSFYGAKVATASGNVVVNFANAVFDAAIAVYAGSNIDLTNAYHVVSNSGNLSTLTVGNLNVPPGGLVLGAVAGNASNMAGGNCIWTGITENWEMQAGNTARRQSGGGVLTPATIFQTIAISLSGMNGGGSEANCGMAISLQPAQ